MNISPLSSIGAWILMARHSWLYRSAVGELGENFRTHEAFELHHIPRKKKLKPSTSSLTHIPTWPQHHNLQLKHYAAPSILRAVILNSMSNWSLSILSSISWEDPMKPANFFSVLRWFLLIISWSELDNRSMLLVQWLMPPPDALARAVPHQSIVRKYGCPSEKENSDCELWLEVHII